MRVVYRVIAWITALLVALQASWVAWAVFTIGKALDDGQVVDKSYEHPGFELHPLFGTMIIPALVIILVILSYFTKIAGASKLAWLTFGLLVLQIALAFAAFLIHPFIGVFHALNAFVLVGALITSARRMAPEVRVLPHQVVRS